LDVLSLIFRTVFVGPMSAARLAAGRAKGNGLVVPSYGFADGDKEIRQAI
jgi:hypothetical protein